MKKKGDTKTGGRKLGTPNKVTSSLKEWVSKLLNDQRKQFESDLESLTPSERVRVVSNLLNFCIPKQQSFDQSEAIKREYSELSNLLETAPDEAVQRIAEKIDQLKSKKNESE